MLLQNTTVVNHSSTIITKYTEYTCMKESKMHYQTKEDAELWVLLIKGDKLALEIMYRRYFPHLLNYGHTISTNEELIKDCIQDLFVNVFNNSKFRPIDHVKSYLYTALRNNLVYKMSSMKETYQLEMMNWKDSLHTTILIWKEANCYRRPTGNYPPISVMPFICTISKNLHGRKLPKY